MEFDTIVTEISTGGGCEALQYEWTRGDTYALVTDGSGTQIPNATETVIVGIYSPADDNQSIISFALPNLATADLMLRQRLS